MPRSNDPPIRPRMVATLMLIPLSVAALILTYTALAFVDDWGLPWLVGVVLAFFTPVAVFHFGGLIIWWPTVAWTAKKRRAVYAISLGLIGVIAGLMVAALFLTSSGDPYGLVAMLMGILLVPLIFVLGAVATFLTSLVCYERRAAAGEEDQPVVCPKCQYDLRGQREARCPECGEAFTLGELIPPREE